MFAGDVTSWNDRLALKSTGSLSGLTTELILILIDSLSEIPAFKWSEKVSAG